MKQGGGNIREAALGNALQTLEEHLAAWRKSGGRDDVAVTIMALAVGAREMRNKIAVGPLLPGSSPDFQQHLDDDAVELFRGCLEQSPVAIVGTEKNETVKILDASRRLAVAIDPLHGSSNIDTNLSTGTIFAIFPVPVSGVGGIETALMQPGREQLAAGFFIYGPNAALVLTLRQGTHVFTLDPRDGHFYLTKSNLKVPESGNEYSINASNYRHWQRAIRDYIDDLIAGVSGPRGKDFNMRWSASMVAESYRILGRGGIYLYPRDSRPGYESGRVGLICEANPMALIFEEAGGGATDGVNRILDLVPTSLRQRVPLVVGSAEKVGRVARYFADAPAREQSSPLFNERGLFRV